MGSINQGWTGDTLIATTEGIKSFKELAEIGKIDIYCMDINTQNIYVRTMRNIRRVGKNKSVTKITVYQKEGNTQDLYVRPKHNLYVPYKYNIDVLVKTKAKHLKIGDKLVSYRVDIKEPESCILDSTYVKEGYKIHGEIIKIERKYKVSDVYYGTVDDFFTYFVCSPQETVYSPVRAVLSADWG